MNNALRDWLFNLVWDFQDATAATGNFTEDENGETQVTIEPFHPVVDIIMSLPAPEGEGELRDWYHNELHKRIERMVHRGAEEDGEATFH